MQNIVNKLKDLIPSKTRNDLKYLYLYQKNKDEFKKTRNLASTIIVERRSKQIVNVLFIITMPQVWNSLKSLFEYANNDARFSAHILVQPSVRDGNTDYEIKNSQFYKDLVSEYGESVIPAYANGEWQNIESLYPDFVFYTRPYTTDYYEKYRPEFTKKYALNCYVPYGTSITKGFIIDGVYNTEFLRHIRYVFSTDCFSYELMSANYQKPIQCNCLKILNFGYPRFSLVGKSDKLSHQDEDKSINILWTPRWTSEVEKWNKKGNFLNYKNEFVRFIKNNNSSFHLTIRPHPLMFSNYLDTGVMTQEEIDLFFKICTEADISFDKNDDFLPSLQAADVLVSDCSSILAEYFFLNRPIIYCDTNKDLTEMGNIIYSSSKVCDSWEKIEKTLLDLSIGIDDKAKDREKNLQLFKQMNPVDANKTIIDYIYSEIQ